jgi:hypothetical protein
MEADGELQIGRIDKADFPTLSFTKIKVKIDTGAYTSSIHCSKVVEMEDGQLQVTFLDPSIEQYTGYVHYFKEFSKKRVKSSNAKVENRYFVTIPIRLFGKRYPVLFSLTNRGDMRYPVLLGRRFLANHGFVVNPKLQYQSQKSKADKKKR